MTGLYKDMGLIEMTERAESREEALAQNLDKYNNLRMICRIE